MKMSKAERRAKEIHEQVAALIKEYSSLDIKTGGFTHEPVAMVVMAHPAPSGNAAGGKMTEILVGDPLILGHLAWKSRVVNDVIQCRKVYEHAENMRGMGR